MARLHPEEQPIPPITPLIGEEHEASRLRLVTTLLFIEVFSIGIGEESKVYIVEHLFTCKLEFLFIIASNELGVFIHKVEYLIFILNRCNLDVDILLLLGLRSRLHFDLEYINYI